MNFQRLGSADEFSQTGDTSAGCEDSSLIYQPLAEGEFDDGSVIELTESDLVEAGFSRRPTAVATELQSADTIVRKVDPFSIAAIRNDASAGTVHISTILNLQDWLDGLNQTESQAA